MSLWKIIPSIILILLIIGCNKEDTSIKNMETSIDGQITAVSKNGLLHVEGNKIVNKDGKVVALHGMSLFWSQWGGKFYNANCIKWLKNDWKCNIVRAAIGVDGGGYLDNRNAEMEKLFNVITACINEGIYVIVDWHDHRAEHHLEEAKDFFSKIAKKYNDKPNLIYEIYNEPLQVDWSKEVKPYAIEVIKAIREYDKSNLIVVGTPNWSQFVDEAASDPIDDSNIAYSFHYYTSTHTQLLRDRAIKAIELGAPLFVTEFGISEANGNGKIDYAETEKWIKFADDNNLSWCNWSIVDKGETSAALVKGANPEGNWSDEQISESGKFIKNLISKRNKVQ